jgi:hypothetical protein
VPNRVAFLIVCIALGVGAFATWSLTRGQAPTPTPPAPLPTGVTEKAAAMPKPSAETTAPIKPVSAHVPEQPKLSKYTPLQKQMYLSVQRGADWLFRANRADGRFDPGYVPALASVMEGEHYLRQAGAAFALARTARFTGDERHTARARQAILTLLGDTSLSPSDPVVRRTTLPGAVVNRLASAGLLLLAIHELPAPEKDLLEQSDQLCNYIRAQQRADGSLATGDQTATPDDPAAVAQYPGLALHGLMRSQAHRPGAWKTDVARKALAYYRAWWREHKGPGFVPAQTAAATEAYLLTKDAAFAEFAFEMGDWLCGLQYDQAVDLRRATWVGGFRGWSDGKPQDVAPTIATAAYGEALADGCRVARLKVDLPRYRRYSEATERCLQYVTTLQFNESNTQHFAGWYRAKLVGGFHASDQDGDLRIDYTQHAVSAMVQYLRAMTNAEARMTKE